MNFDLLNEIKKLKSNPPPDKLTIHKTKSLIEHTVDKTSVEKTSNTFKNNQLFLGYNFTFPIQDVILSVKLTNILKDEIKSHGGKVYQLNQHNNQINHYYLVSQKINQQKLKKCLKHDHFRSNTLNYKFIKDCINQNMLLDLQLYRFFTQKTIKSEKFPPIQTKIIEQVTENQNLYQNQLKLQTRQNYAGTGEKIYKKIKTNSGKFKKISILGQSQDSISVDSQEVHVIQVFNLNQEKRKKNQQIWNSKKQHFVCQKGSSLQKPYNAYICEQLAKLQSVYETEKDIGRSIAYLKAISAIKSLNKEIKDAKDVQQLRGVGPKIVKKIIQIIQTGKLQKLQFFQKDEKYEVKNLLSRVWGIGPATSIDLYKKGIKTIQQLRQHEDLLTKNQKIGLKYFEQFQIRIPRSQVEQIENIVKKEIIKLSKNTQIHFVQTCGSYRRGKQTCGDIDIIITRKDGVFQKQFLNTLILKLQEIKLITDHLSTPRSNVEHQSLSYMGVCQLTQKSIHRRLDLKYYPLQQYAYALLYFTGSDMFNRSIRLFARKKGYSLSDHGLYPVIRDHKANKTSWEGQNIVCFTQKQIFDFLGIDFKTPQDRNV